MLLTSEAGEALRSVETVIIDEIHALVPTKRGSCYGAIAGEAGGADRREVQRIGLSATQEPLEEVARFWVGRKGREEEKGKREKETVTGFWLRL